MSISNSKTMFATKLMSFAVGVLVLQAAIYWLYHARQLPPELEHAAKLAERNVDIVYFGDSTTIAVCSREPITARMVDFFRKEMPEHDVGLLTHDAYMGELYAAYSGYLARRGAQPQTVIVPINLRSFSVEWNMNPAYQFVRLRYFLSHDDWLSRAALQPLSVFHAVQLAPVTDAEYLSAMVYDGNEPVATFGELVKRGEEGDADALRNRFMYCYLYPMSREHPRLQALLETVRNIRAMGAEPVFYFTPIDVETGTREYGTEFPARVEQTVALIQGALTEEGVHALDLSDAAPAQWFCYGSGLNEHLHAEGLELVARAVADFINGDGQGN